MAEFKLKTIDIATAGLTPVATRVLWDDKECVLINLTYQTQAGKLTDREGILRYDKATKKETYFEYKWQNNTGISIVPLKEGVGMHHANVIYSAEGVPVYTAPLGVKLNGEVYRGNSVMAKNDILMESLHSKEKYPLVGRVEFLDLYNGNGVRVAGKPIWARQCERITEINGEDYTFEEVDRTRDGLMDSRLHLINLNTRQIVRTIVAEETRLCTWTQNDMIEGGYGLDWEFRIDREAGLLGYVRYTEDGRESKIAHIPNTEDLVRTDLQGYTAGNRKFLRSKVTEDVFEFKGKQLVRLEPSMLRGPNSYKNVVQNALSSIVLQETDATGAALGPIYITDIFKAYPELDGGSKVNTITKVQELF